MIYLMIWYLYVSNSEERKYIQLSKTMIYAEIPLKSRKI